MRVMPVLDLYDGQAVHAVAGDRDRYGPLDCAWIGSAEPRQVARRIRDRYRLQQLYVADLTAIRSGHAASDGRASAREWAAIRRLAADKWQLWIDAGWRDAEDFRSECPADLRSAVAGWVVGLESLSPWSALGELGRAMGWGQLVLSLDLMAGGLLVPGDWQATRVPLELVQQAVQQGLQRLLVLDLAAVGTASGPVTEPLLGAIRTRHAGLELWTGGGVRGLDDLQRLERQGVARVLVASALYRQQLQPADLAGYR